MVKIDTYGPEEEDLYSLLMKLKPAGLKRAEWAREAGVSSSFFQGIKKGHNPRTDSLEKVLGAIDVSPAQFYALRALDSMKDESGGVARINEKRMPFRGLEPVRRFSLLATSMGEGFDGLEDYVELTKIHPHEIVQHMPRPPVLADDKDAYAITIVGDSMWPRFRPGRHIAVSPRASLSLGDDVVVQLDDGDGDDDGGKEIQVMIKELVRRTPTFIELRQFYPDTTFRVDAKKILSIHKVLGELF
jgi:SOS-response transcriptional repressor LexA